MQHVTGAASASPHAAYNPPPTVRKAGPASYNEARTASGVRGCTAARERVLCGGIGGRHTRRAAPTAGMGRGEHALVPVVRVTGVLPQLRTVKLLGALMSYHSFLVKGSTPRCEKRSSATQQSTTAAAACPLMVWVCPSERRPSSAQRPAQGRQPPPPSHDMHSQGRVAAAYTFFPFPFFPLLKRLFFPTAWGRGQQGLRAGVRTGQQGHSARWDETDEASRDEDSGSARRR